MPRPSLTFCIVAASSFAAFGADRTSVSVSQIYDRDLTSMERELVPLAEAMPADKYDFAPTGGEFKGVRTFGKQVSHVATVIYEVSASVLGVKSPIDPGENENGAASLRTKEQIVKYLKDAIAEGHKAMKSLTALNLTGLVKSAFGDEQVPRASMASVAVWHSFDHYGQMVVYARMNGIIPPASRR